MRSRLPKRHCLGLVLLVFIDPLDDFDPNLQCPKAWVDQVYDQEGIANIGDVRAVLSFRLNLRLVCAEVHQVATDSAHTGVLFDRHVSVRHDGAGVQCRRENE